MTLLKGAAPSLKKRVGSKVKKKCECSAQVA